MSKEAMKLALEAADELEWMLKSGYEQGREGPPRVHRLIGKIKALAEQPAQQEPVAWMWKDGTITSDPDRADGTWMPLYTTPQAQPAQRTWVGLTDEERNAIGRHHAYVDNIIRATEAKLREKNA